MVSSGDLGGWYLPFLSPTLPSGSPRAFFQVQSLEKIFAKFIGADHDGTGGGCFDDPWEEALGKEQRQKPGVMT